MKSVEFEGTVKIAEHQEEYHTVHGHLGRDGDFPVITLCFELTQEEKLLILQTGKIWYQQLSTQLRPMNLSVNKPTLIDR